MRLLLSLIFVLFGCSKNNEYQSKLSLLKDNQAHVEVFVEGESFYADSPIFEGEITLTSLGMDLNLVNEKGANLQIQANKNNWIKNKKWVFHISSMSLPNFTEYGNFLLGRRDENGLNGYILSRMTIECKALSTELCVLAFDGKMVRPQNAIIEEFEVPVKGTIVFKNPKYNLFEVEEADLTL